MNTHADKDQQVTHFPAPHFSNTSSPIYFSDQRPEAALQMKWQAMAANSPRVQQFKAFQHIADQAIQRQGALEDEELLQGKFEPIQKMGGPEEEELFQGKFKIAQLKSLGKEEPLQGKFEPVQLKKNNTGLPDNIKSGIENLSGMAMDDVKVHYNSDRPAPLQAHAYTQGADIHVAPGQEKHLAHEAWHVVQQKQGRVQPTMSLNGQKINDDTSLEKEADDMGAKAIQNRAIQKKTIERKVNLPVLQGQFTFEFNNGPEAVKTREEGEDVATHLYDEYSLDLEDAGITAEALSTFVGDLAENEKNLGELSGSQIVERAISALSEKKVEKKEKEWAMEGEFGVLSKKAYNELHGIGCKDEDIQESLDTQNDKAPLGVWNVIKLINKGVYELKVEGSGKTRCEGKKGQSGKIEFNSAGKGRGK